MTVEITGMKRVSKMSIRKMGKAPLTISANGPVALDKVVSLVEIGLFVCIYIHKESRLHWCPAPADNGERIRPSLQAPNYRRQR